MAGSERSFCSSEEAFTGIVCFHIVHAGTGDQPFVLFPVGSETYASVVRILPDRAILRRGPLHPSFPEFVLSQPIIQEGTPERLVTFSWMVVLAMRSTFSSNSDRSAISLLGTRMISSPADRCSGSGWQKGRPQTVLDIVVGAAASSQNQSFAREEAAFGIFAQIESYGIGSSLVVDAVSTVLADRDEFTLVVVVPDDLASPAYFSRP